MPPAKPRILLSEGSSLSAREAITVLGLAGHRVELVSSDPLCLGRFSRFVERVHRAPASGADPDGYLGAVLDIVKTRAIDVLLPVPASILQLGPADPAALAWLKQHWGLTDRLRQVVRRPKPGPGRRLYQPALMLTLL